MTALLFLVVPIIVVTVGCIVMWLRARKPNTLHSGIDGFRREMDALAPERRRRGRSAGGAGGAAADGAPHDPMDRTG